MTSARLSFDKSRVGGRVTSFMLYYEFIWGVK
jgi:hypothetical protein